MDIMASVGVSAQVLKGCVIVHVLAVINPRRMCRRVTVLGLCVSVCDDC